jgi:hypothetical protein
VSASKEYVGIKKPSGGILGFTVITPALISKRTKGQLAFRPRSKAAYQRDCSIPVHHQLQPAVHVLVDPPDTDTGRGN